MEFRINRFYFGRKISRAAIFTLPLLLFVVLLEAYTEFSMAVGFTPEGIPIAGNKDVENPAIALAVTSGNDLQAEWQGETYGGYQSAGYTSDDWYGNYDTSTSEGQANISTQLAPGEYSSDMWSNINVYTNSKFGYSIYINDADEDTALNNVSGRGKIPTGSAPYAGEAYWGVTVMDPAYILAPETSTAYQYTYEVPPASEEGACISSSETPTSEDGETTYVRYAVSTSPWTQAGFYEDEIVISAVTGEVWEAYNSYYYSMVGLNVPNEDIDTGDYCETDGYETTCMVDLNYIPSIDGVIFNGWSEKPGDSNVEFEPGSQVAIIGSVVFYPVFEYEDGYNKFFYADAESDAPVTFMQDFTTQTCNLTTTPYRTATEYDMDGSHSGDRNYIPYITVQDFRDLKEYGVAKMADGNCYMMEDIRLGNVGEEVTPVLAADSDTEDDLELSYVDPMEWDNTTEDLIFTVANNFDGEEKYYYNHAAFIPKRTENATISKTICPKGWSTIGFSEILMDLEGITNHSEPVERVNILNMKNNGHFYEKGVGLKDGSYYSSDWYYSYSSDTFRAVVLGNPNMPEMQFLYINNSPIKRGVGSPIRCMIW